MTRVIIVTTVEVADEDSQSMIGDVVGELSDHVSGLLNGTWIAYGPPADAVLAAVRQQGGQL